MKHFHKWQLQQQTAATANCTHEVLRTLYQARGGAGEGAGRQGVPIEPGGMQWWGTALSAPKSAGLLTCTWEKWEPF